MEFYILDSLYRQDTVIDRFESFIWTERFSSYGDFQIEVESTPAMRTRFAIGKLIGCSESYRIMMIEVVEDITDEEGKAYLKLTGRSLERILEDRLALAALTDLDTDPKWILTGLPKDLAEQLYHDICVTGILDTGDIISTIDEDSSIFPADTIDAPTDTITYTIDPKSLYLAIKELCDFYAMGFRIVKDPTTSQLYFDIYMGRDRTSQQTVDAAVIFSPSLDNLKDTNRLKSIAGYKNVAYVISKAGHEVVYWLDVDPAIDGFERQVLLVKMDDLDALDPDASDKMIQKGKEELSKHRQFEALDGQLGVNSLYKYGIDYNLGDLVEIRDGAGTTSQMQVTEQIFVSDKEGVRSYPTLTVNIFVTPGSWLSVPAAQVWNDLDLDSTHWADMP